MIPCESLSEFDVSHLNNDGHEVLIGPLPILTTLQKTLKRLDVTLLLKADSFLTNHEHNSISLPLVKLSLLLDKIQIAWAEICALLDIISTIKDSKYIKLNLVAHEYFNSKLSLLFSGKKVAIDSGLRLLNKKIVILRKHFQLFSNTKKIVKQENFANFSKRNPSITFHFALIRLRKYWRLRFVGNTIVGDLSLRLKYGFFNQSSSFTVEETENSMESFSPVQLILNNSLLTDLKLTSGKITIQVECKRSMDLTAGKLALNVDSSSATEPFRSLSRCLIFSQQVLFCREIVSVLFKESCCKSSRNSLNENLIFISNNEVIINLSQCVRLSINMILNINASYFNKTINADIKNLPQILQVRANNSNTKTYNLLMKNIFPVQLMRIFSIYHKSINFHFSSTCVPCSASVQIPKTLRSSGALAIGIFNLTKEEKSPTICTKISELAGFTCYVTPDPILSLTSRPSDRNNLDFISNSKSSQIFHSSDNRYLFNISNLKMNFQNNDDSHSYLKPKFSNEPKILDKFIELIKHFNLRKKVSLILDEFARIAPFCLTVNWHTRNSPYYTNARLQMFYNDYDTYKHRISIYISSKFLIIYYPNSSQKKRIMVNQLNTLLHEHILQIHMNLIKMIALQLLGWNLVSNLRFLTEDCYKVTIPYGVLIISSPNFNFVVCLKISSTGVSRCFVTSIPNIFNTSNIKFPISELDTDIYVSLDNTQLFEANFQTIFSSCKEVDMNNLCGQNILEKIEYCLVHLDEKSN